MVMLLLMCHRQDLSGTLQVKVSCTSQQVIDWMVIKLAPFPIVGHLLLKSAV